MRTVLAVTAFALAAGVLTAQPAPVAPTQPALPSGQPVSRMVPVGGSDLAPLPGGKDVSQPLQPVGPDPGEAKEPAPGTKPEAKEIPPETPRGPLGPSWDNAELLYWWPTRAPVPALAYGTQPVPPSLAALNNALPLAGGHAIGSQPSAGGRFTLGTAIDTEETVGWEATYLFLGSRTFKQNVRSFAGGTAPSFGVPYTDATTGASQILPLAQPGVADALLVADTSVRVQGWEVNGVANVLDEKYVKLNAIVGWRYFQVNESLLLGQEQFRYGPAGGIFRTADQFNTQNRFNGGQIGFNTDMHRGLLFCELTAKVAFGQTYEVMRNDGTSNFYASSPNGPVARVYSGSGIYIQPSNAGRTASGVFAVLPEGTVKFGLRLGDTGRLYFGYSFLYLSDVARPGDQVDRTLNPAQLPLVNGTGPVSGADRPARLINRSDFWVQGLVIGLETRY